MLTPGWWLALDGEQTYLRDLAMHLKAPELRVVEDDTGFYLGSTDFAAFATPDEVRRRGADLIAIACGACEVELGGFRRHASSRRYGSRNRARFSGSRR